MSFGHQNPIGVYIHYPFCKEICPYCDFNKYLNPDKIDFEEIFLTYKKEIDFFINKLEASEKTLYSIYFGGGTPSLMSPFLTKKLIDYILEQFDQKNSFIEITMEANPTSFEAKKFRQFKDAGVNRLSLGVQSFIDKELQFLGRKHTSLQAQLAIKSAQDIFDKTTFDLMYGLPGQNLDQLEFNLQKLFSFNSCHVSLYPLTIKEGTPFDLFVKQGRFKEKTEEEMSCFMDKAWESMHQAGFYQYEISNFSTDSIRSLSEIKKETNLSVHNLIYWQYCDYIGIGAGACGRLKIKNQIYETKIVNSLKNWLAFNNSIEFKEVNLQEAACEVIISGLRSKFGVDVRRINLKLESELFDYLNPLKINEFIESGHLDLASSNLSLTQKGMKFADYITLNILK